MTTRFLFILFVFSICAVLIGAANWTVGSAIGVTIVARTAPMILSRSEINDCAVIEARKDELKDDEGDQQSADDSILVDYGDPPDVVRMADQYDFVGPTIFRRYVNDGIFLCLFKKLTRQKIEMPSIKLRAGYHITRWNGSASLVKNGDPEPIFGCETGYHPNPNGEGCTK